MESNDTFFIIMATIVSYLLMYFYPMKIVNQRATSVRWNIWCYMYMKSLLVLVGLGL